jgi:hypothetical protein
MLKRILFFYVDGFRSMQTGRRLWAIIFIKLFVMFAILKLFFFPNYLETHFTNDEERAGHVLDNITRPPHSALPSDRDRDGRGAPPHYMTYNGEPHRTADPDIGLQATREQNTKQRR